MEQEPPKIEFPCDYPIKVLGRHSDEFSSKGTFTSITITIIATGPDQLEALHQSLLATGRVQMVI